MELKAQQLKAHLEKSLLPVYLVSGDEPLQVDESMHLLRQIAQQKGFIEREVFYVERGFRWELLTEQTSNMSLFGDKKIIELRLASPKPGVEGAKALLAFCEQLPEDILLLIQCGKLDKSALKTKWCSTLKEVGAVLRIWNLMGAELIAWAQNRLRAEGLPDDRQIAEFITSRSEGNMFAAAQEIEKMSLLQLGTNEEQVKPWLENQSKYTVFDLVDTILLSDRNRVLKVLRQIKEESLAPNLVVWALSELIRGIIYSSQHGMQKGIQNTFYYSKRDRLQAKAYKFKTSQLYILLTKCARLDQMVKGRASGNVWDGFTDVSLKLAR